jgi:hypothetical protein
LAVHVERGRVPLDRAGPIAARLRRLTLHVACLSFLLRIQGGGRVRPTAADQASVGRRRELVHCILDEPSPQ